jgi:hypothetical protein
MHKSLVSATINLLFCTAPPDVYAFLTAEAYPAAFAPFPPIELDISDYTACTNKNKHATAKAMHAINKKTQADIVTMNTALTDVFLEALSLQVRAFFLQWRVCEPNIVFVDMFVWFVDHYGKTTAEDCKANCQRIAAKWHPTNGFDTLVLHLFTGAAFTRCTNFTMAGCEIVNIGLCVISVAACMSRSTRRGSHVRPSVQESSKLSTLSNHLGHQRSPWSTRPPSPPVNMGMEWPPPMTTTPLLHMRNLSQTLVPCNLPPKNQSSCRAQQLHQCKANLTP